MTGTNKGRQTESVRGAEWGWGGENGSAVTEQAARGISDVQEKPQTDLRTLNHCFPVADLLPTFLLSNPNLTNRQTG